LSFEQLQLIEPILLALREEGYVQPTPIQSKSIPAVLEGRDLLGCAQTGTGKTAAFAIPIIQILHQNNLATALNNTVATALAPENPIGNRMGGNTTSGKKLIHKTARKSQPIKALILTPTRELAIQIEESFKTYGKHTPLKCTVIFGGVSQHAQVQSLQNGTDILVATPGRLLDLIQQALVDLSRLEIFVLDEADRMLDMGFVHDVKRVITKLPAQRQSLFFSATMAPEIKVLAGTILRNPFQVEVTPVSSTAETIQQKIYFTEKDEKIPALIAILKESSADTTLVFTRTKHGADKLAKKLSQNGFSADAIHGNKSQNARQRALLAFRNKELKVLVATDIAARGIDIDELSFVVNFELPNVPETYVHRIGRTGRAGASGMAISLCDREERAYLKDIQKLIRLTIPVGQLPTWDKADWNAKQEKQKTEFASRNPRNLNLKGSRNDRDHDRDRVRDRGQSSARPVAARNNETSSSPRPSREKLVPQKGGNMALGKRPNPVNPATRNAPSAVKPAVAVGNKQEKMQPVSAAKTNSSELNITEEYLQKVNPTYNDLSW
jgi:ATP-dependent RNA helicase RhlE